MRHTQVSLSIFIHTWNDAIEIGAQWKKSTSILQKSYDRSPMNLLLSICFRSLIKEESNGCGKKSSLLKTIARMHGDILIQTSWTMQCMCSHEGDDHTATNRSCSYNRHCPKNIAVQLVNNGSHTQRERERTYTNLIANAIYNLPMGGCMGVRMW